MGKMNVELYFENLVGGVRKEYKIAEEARKKNLDPVNHVEIPLAMSLAEKAIGLIATIYPQLKNSGVVERIFVLEKEYGQLDVAVSFKIAEEVAKEKFCKFESLLQAIDAGIRVGFAYNTLGVVASPIEGYTQLKLGKTKNGEDYFIAYFSGPIRSAGTTATCVVFMLIDYLRELFGFAKYDPDENEIKRYVTENFDYHEKVTNLQYLPTEEEIIFLAKNLPIQISGEPTEQREVSNYKDLPRVDTNQIRGGMCLAFSEGLAQKAQKGMRLLRGVKEKGFKSSGWDFLEDYIELHKKRETGNKDVTATYIKDLVAGRPVFGHPSRSGGFRFRYGRSRVAGFSATSVHPATMGISNCFLSSGTQLKIEKPTKGCVISSCDSIDGPIVKLKDGSVKKLYGYEEAKKIYSDVEEIIYLGDLLFPLGDVINRNAELLKPGYVEEWWGLELKKVLKEQNEDIKFDAFDISFKKAAEISERFGIPLHPSYIFYWSQIENEDFFWLLDWLQNCNWRDKLLLPYSKSVRGKFKEGKRALELLGVEHDVVFDNVVVKNGEAFLANLGVKIDCIDFREEFKRKIQEAKEGRSVLEIVNNLSQFKIKDKAGTFIGARMGRPEKAKLRKLTGSPSVLFPIGKEGGRFRSVNAAVEVGHIRGDFPLYFCGKCKKETIYRVCEKCGEETRKRFYCWECEKVLDKKCEKHERVRSYSTRNIDSKYYFDKAREFLGMEKWEVPELIKGVRGTSSEEHDFENVAKGILRSKFNLCVNKDGTIRYDGTELPITHFKPKEIRVCVEKLKELGYVYDIDGKELENGEQILEIMPHDILLPSCPETKDEKADDVFLNISKFVDDELERFYKLPRYYNLKIRDDLVGQLVVCMAPHNCAGVVGRIIGFTKTQSLTASPYMHAAMRRDCFGYDSYFPIKEGSRWRILKIGDLVERLKPDKIVDSFGTKEKKVNDFETIGFDKNLKQVSVNNFTKHTKMPMLEITTALGKKIKVTENHKFLIDGKRKRASDLKIGDVVALPRRIKIKEGDFKQFNLLELLKDENLMVRGIGDLVDKLDLDKRNEILKQLKISKKQFQNFHIRDSYPVSFVLQLKDFMKSILKKGKLALKRDNVEIPILVNLDNDLLELIGLYVAEGYSRSINGELNQVYVSSSERMIRDFVRKTIEKHFGLKQSENKKDRVTFSSKILYLFFTKILEAGSYARDKRIPYLFLNLPLDRLACVLRGYFEGDGSAERNRKKVSCDSVGDGFLHDLEFCLARFGIFAKRYVYEKEPGDVVKNFYVKKKREIPKFKITKLIIGADFIDNFKSIGFLSKRKNSILEGYSKMKNSKMKIKYDENFVYDSIICIDECGEEQSYCLNVDTENHLVVGNGIISQQCDGDEAAIMLLLDVLINFSRKFLPSHRGGSQDAPLVLNARIRASEVDDQILDFELCFEYPLELYELAEKEKHSGEVKIETVGSRLKEGREVFEGCGFTHNCSDFNFGVINSAYKSLPTMKDKVNQQMDLVVKLRAVDTSDVAHLIIDRHFIRDLRGNLRKFSHQIFRCVACNEKFRRPPMSGVCTKCGGKIIFTISEGSIKKYLEPAIELAEKYDIPAYTKQGLELTKFYIESIFGKDLDKQVELKKWF